MTAYVVVNLTVIDADKAAEYSAKAAETLKPFGGEFVAKGPIVSLHGVTGFSAQAIIAFPDKASAEGWYQSDEYQSIVALRNVALNSTFTLVG